MVLYVALIVQSPLWMLVCHSPLTRRKEKHFSPPLDQSNERRRKNLPSMAAHSSLFILGGKIGESWSSSLPFSCLPTTKEIFFSLSLSFPSKCETFHLARDKTCFCFSLLRILMRRHVQYAPRLIGLSRSTLHILFSLNS